MSLTFKSSRNCVTETSKSLHTRDFDTSVRLDGLVGVVATDVYPVTDANNMVHHNNHKSKFIHDTKNFNKKSRTQSLSTTLFLSILK